MVDGADRQADGIVPRSMNLSALNRHKKNRPAPVEEFIPACFPPDNPSALHPASSNRSDDIYCSPLVADLTAVRSGGWSKAAGVGWRKLRRHVGKSWSGDFWRQPSWRYSGGQDGLMKPVIIRNRRDLTVTPRQFQFVREYLKDLNATQAMIRSGYSPRTANKHMPRLMNHPEIRRLIDTALADRNNKVTIEATAMLEDIASAARSDLVDARANLQAATGRLRSALFCIRDVERLCARPAQKPERRFEGGCSLLGKTMVSEELSEPEHSDPTQPVDPDYLQPLPHSEPIGSAALDYDPFEN